MLVAVVQGCKTALTAAMLPYGRAATADEMAAFVTIHLDLVRSALEAQLVGSPISRGSSRDRW